jgi:hypothetical protein
MLFVAFVISLALAAPAVVAIGLATGRIEAALSAGARHRLIVQLVIVEAIMLPVLGVALATGRLPAGLVAELRELAPVVVAGFAATLVDLHPALRGWRGLPVYAAVFVAVLLTAQAGMRLLPATS